MPAFNEASIIEKKIQNLLSINYPADKWKVIIVNDGSTDSTQSILQKYSSIQCIHFANRKGKPTAINEAMKQVTTPFVIFSDANAIYNRDAVTLLMQHFSQTNVGGVSGEKRIIRQHEYSAASVERTYLKYESFIKSVESTFHSLTGTTGEIFCIRTQLFEPIPENLILDDFFISMGICLKGFRFNYEAKAFSIETPSATVNDEMKRKIRISSGYFQIMKALPGMLQFIKHPILFFQFFSHKLLRWFFSPIALLLLFSSNLLIVFDNPSFLFTLFFSMQCLFYFVALVGWIKKNNNRFTGFVSLPFYFVFTNVCIVMGMIEYFLKGTTILWKKADRDLQMS